LTFEDVVGATVWLLVGTTAGLILALVRPGAARAHEPCAVRLELARALVQVPKPERDPSGAPVWAGTGNLLPTFKGELGAVRRSYALPFLVTGLIGSTEQSPLVETDVPRPQPRRGELVVRAHAAGVTSRELLWYPTTHEKNGGTRRGAVQGHEFSGDIAAVGEGTTGFEIG
jgi:hypothetical protein